MIPPEPRPEPHEAEHDASQIEHEPSPEDVSREGSQLFDAALAFGLVRGVSLLLAAIGWMRLHEREGRWAWRLAALGALDLGVFVALAIAMVMTASQLGGGALLAPMPPTGGGPASATLRILRTRYPGAARPPPEPRTSQAKQPN